MQNMEDRLNILRRMVKNRIHMDTFEQSKKQETGKKKVKKDKSNDSEELQISEFAIEAVLKRYLRYCIDQQGIDFIYWRAKTVHNSKKSYKEQQMIKYALFMSDQKEIKLRVDKDNLQTDTNNLGNKIENLIPCLKADSDITE